MVTALADQHSVPIRRAQELALGGAVTESFLATIKTDGSTTTP
jgi:hypothetical protein